MADLDSEDKIAFKVLDIIIQLCVVFNFTQNVTLFIYQHLSSSIGFPDDFQCLLSISRLYLVQTVSTELTHLSRENMAEVSFY